MLAVILLAGCGKRGAPLPPLRPTPARVTGATYRMIECQMADREELARRLATRTALPTQPREIFELKTTQLKYNPIVRSNLVNL